MDRILRDYGRVKLIKREIDPRAGDDLVIEVDGIIRQSFNSLSNNYAYNNAYRMTSVYRKALANGAIG